MRIVVALLAVVALSAPIAKADHHEPSEWWKYLVGTWSEERIGGGTSEAIFKMAPTGKAIILEYRQDNGWTTFIVTGHQGENEVGIGYGLNGAYTQTTIKRPVGDKHEGVSVGCDPEGNSWTGKYLAEKLSKDKWKYKFECKYDGGDRKEFEFGGTLTRKK
jgi:hypothetical protein